MLNFGDLSSCKVKDFTGVRVGKTNLIPLAVSFNPRKNDGLNCLPMSISPDCGLPSVHLATIYFPGMSNYQISYINICLIM